MKAIADSAVVSSSPETDTFSSLEPRVEIADVFARA
jgi:hypothetical protein